MTRVYKALSVRQPWAWAILHAGKRIENRVKWPGCSYRGTVLLHAAKGCTRAEFRDAIEFMAMRSLVSDAGWPVPAGTCDPPDARPVPEAPTREALAFGAIVGVARIVGVLRPGDAERHNLYLGPNPAAPWWAGGFALVLDDVVPLPVLPWKGALGLFDVALDPAVHVEPLRALDAWEARHAA